MNKVILLGYVGRDPRMRMESGLHIADFPLATNERSSANLELTEWHNIVMTGQAADFAEKYIRKGSFILLEGKLRTRRWNDAAGISRSRTEIYVDSFELLPSRS